MNSEVLSLVLTVLMESLLRRMDHLLQLIALTAPLGVILMKKMAISLVSFVQQIITGMVQLRFVRHVL
jgi:fumarate reductase subunit D